MNPIKLFKLFRDYEKLQDILKEKIPMIKKVTQIVLILGTIFSTLGINQSVTNWVDHNTAVFGLLVALAQLFHAVLPKIFDKPVSSSDATKTGLLLLVLLLIPATLKAQTLPEAPATHPQNLYAGGASYSVGASPAIAGTGLYAHNIGPADADPGLYAFTVVDALPNTVKPFTVSTNIGAGIAQELFTIDKIPVYLPTAAGISWNGSNTGWQWNGGAMASIHVKGDYYILPSVRFLKSSVSGGTGYQPIIGVLFGWGK